MDSPRPRRFRSRRGRSSKTPESRDQQPPGDGLSPESKPRGTRRYTRAEKRAARAEKAALSAARAAAAEDAAREEIGKEAAREEVGGEPGKEGTDTAPPQQSDKMGQNQSSNREKLPALALVTSMSRTPSAGKAPDPSPTSLRFFTPDTSGQSPQSPAHQTPVTASPDEFAILKIRLLAHEKSQKDLRDTLVGLNHERNLDSASDPAQKSRLTSRIQALEMENKILANSLQTSEETAAVLRNEKAALEEQLTWLKAAIGGGGDGNIDFEARVNTLKRQSDEAATAGQLVGDMRLTRRKLLMSVICETADGQSGTSNALDVQLTTAEAIRYMASARRSIEPRLVRGTLSHGFAICSLCRMPRFTSAPGADGTVSEIIDAQFAIGLGGAGRGNCREVVCTSCYPRAFRRAIIESVWDLADDGWEGWIRCLGHGGGEHCGKRLGVLYNTDVREVLVRAGCPGNLRRRVQHHFHVATGVRRALARECLSRDTFELAIRLHVALMEAGVMGDVFTKCITDKAPYVMIEPLEQVERISLDVEEQVVEVPLIMGLLAKKDEKECSVCGEFFCYLERPAQNQNSFQLRRLDQVVNQFPGEWLQRLDRFPAPELVPECTHESAICLTCVGGHISARVESAQGAPIPCPEPGCDHTYTHAQMRVLANGTDFEKWDRDQTVFQHLSKLPNFRWCLGPGCGSGQIYDIVAVDVGGSDSSSSIDWFRAQANRIMCEACGFEMCFRHQTPWHEGDGITCEAWESAQRAEFGANEAWIQGNTRPCPGRDRNGGQSRCGAPVQKNGGCAHMTCKICSWEFCWGCGQDWHSHGYNSGRACVAEGGENAEVRWWVV